MNKYFLFLLSFVFIISTNSVIKAGTIAPTTVSGARTISTQTAKLLLDRGYPFVDVRDQADFDNGHLPNAYHLSIKSTDFTVDNLRKIAAPDEAIIFYCNGVTCMGSADAVAQTVHWGWQKVFYYREGYKGWLEAGY